MPGMVRALRPAANLFNFLPLEGEDEQFLLAATRLATLKAVTKILDTYNPP